MVPLEGRVTVWLPGTMDKLNVETGTVTTSVAFTECASDPLVPVIGIEYVPAASVEAAVSVKVALLGDPGTGTGVDAVIPGGGVTVQVTVPVKPLEGVAVSV